MEWIIGISGLTVANILVWVFLWGRRTGGINTKIKGFEERLNNPQVLPECNELFTEIKEKLSNVDGKVEILLLIMKEEQKNKEKRKK